MNPILAFIITEVVKYVPTLAIEIIQLLSKPAFTDADWDALKNKWQGKTYESYDPPGVVPPP